MNQGNVTVALAAAVIALAIVAYELAAIILPIPDLHTISWYAAHDQAFKIAITIALTLSGPLFYIHASQLIPK